MPLAYYIIARLARIVTRYIHLYVHLDFIVHRRQLEGALMTLPGSPPPHPPPAHVLLNCHLNELPLDLFDLL